MVSILISCGLRAAVVLAIGLLAYVALARAAASTRRLILAIAIGAAVVVPIGAAIGPRWTVDAPAALAVFAHDADGAAEVTLVDAPAIARGTTILHAAAPVPEHAIETSTILVLAWLAIALALLGRTLASQLRVRAIVRNASPVEGWSEAHGVAVRASAEIDSPVVAGLLRPTIVIPLDARTWPVERRRLVLLHELAHVRRRDVLVQAIADLACAIQWCNPLAWICARRLRIECELAADDAVLAAGVRPSRYAEELVGFASSIAMPVAALAMAKRSSLAARIESILAARISRAPLATRGTIAVIAIGAAIAVATACTSPQDPIEPAVPRDHTGTAIDPAIQRIADDELATIAKDWAPERSTIVVLDPATGEVLASAGTSDVPITPGSTLKPLVIAAALEAHAIAADQSFDCGPGPRAYGDKTIRDAGENGRLDLAHLLAVSSNVGTTHIFDAIGGDKLATWLRRFHLSGAPAQIPAGYDGARVAIGEGLIATPLEMAAAYGTFANGGVHHAASFDRGGSSAEPLVSADTARSVMALLETAVVDERATGRAARVDGIHVAGKTGTAGWTSDGRDHTYASFIGIADLHARRLVILVGIQASRTDMAGGKAAAPVFARLVKRLP